MAFEIDTKDKEKIIGLISVLAPNAKIYLFGSRARGTNSQWSDINLALDAGEPLSSSVIGELNAIMEATHLPYEVEMLDFYLVTPLMKQSILKDRLIWKS